MRLKDISFSVPQDNLLYDEVLFALCDRGAASDVLRLWESPCYFVVLGRIGKESDDVRQETAGTDGIPVLRRFSGGGTVLQGPGCLNFTLVLSKEHHPQLNDLHRSYRWILGEVSEALRELGVPVEFRPVSDLVLLEGERKFSGNAQRRGRRAVLHHGTILYDFRLELIAKYLRMPLQAPAYRRARSHEAFVANVGLPAGRIKEALGRQFGCRGEGELLTEEERAALARLRGPKTAPPGASASF